MPGSVVIDVVKGPSAGERFEADGASAITLGKSAASTFVLNDPTVSRQHAVIEGCPEDGYRIRDVGSLNGTKFDGKRLPPDGIHLRAGDRFELGSTTIRVVSLPDPTNAVSSERTTPATPRPRMDRAGRPPGGPPGDAPDMVLAASRQRTTAPPRGRRIADDPTLESVGPFSVKRQFGGRDGLRIDAGLDSRDQRTVLVVRVPAGALGFFGRHRFQRECEAWKAQTHPNLVVPYDVGRAGDYVYAAFRYPGGIDLDALSQEGRRSLGVPLAVFVAREICRVLGAVCEQRGFVPPPLVTGRTVLLTPSGDVAIVGMTVPRIPTSSHTIARHAAPEVDGGEPGGERSLVFSVGVLLYELLAREAIDPAAKAMLRVIDTVRIEVPARLAHVVMQAVEARPEARHSSLASLHHALDDVLASLEPGYGATTARTWLEEHIGDTRVD